MTTPHRVPRASRRVAIVAPSAQSILTHRASLVQEMARRRHQILALVPAATGEERDALARLGADTVLFDPSPTGVFSLTRAIRALALALSGWRAQTVLGFGWRTMPLALLAARDARAVRTVGLVTGLPPGDLRTTEGGVSPRRLKRALAAADALVFHNHDDPRRLVKLGLVPADRDFKVVAGAGVDLEHHSPQPLPPLGPGLVFLMLAELHQAKGVEQYATAAEAVKREAPSARFLIAGPTGRGPGGISPHDLRQRGLEYLGALADVRPLLAGCHVYVYPSQAEGMPRSVLEALATGRPVITTDVPGCRETVDEHVNGWLVPPGDAPALAAAMESYLKRPDLIPPAARASRSKAERQFDQRDVVRELMHALELS